MNTGKGNYNKRRIFALGFILSLFILCISVEPRNTNNAASSIDSTQILDIATGIVSDPSDLHLEMFNLQSDVVTGMEQWIIQWTTDGSDIVQVTLASSDLSLIHFVDTRQNLPNLRVPLTEKSAEKVAIDFIDSLAENNLFNLPTDSKYEGIMHTESDWTYSWLHVVEGLLVWDDYVRIQVDPSSGTIRSFASKWSNLLVNDIDTSISSAKTNTVDFRHCETNHYNKEVFLYAGSNDADSYEPVWLYEEILNGYTIGRAFVSIQSGQTISYEGTNYYGDVKLAQGRNSDGTLDPAHTEELEGVKYRLESDNYEVSEWDNYVYRSELISDWDTANVIVFSGHGHGGSAEGSWITTESSDRNGDFGWDRATENTDVPSDMAQADIVYTSSCGGGYRSTIPAIIDRFLANAALDAGAEAFFGFAGSPYTVGARDYSKYFWAAAANGKNFATCKTYASSYISDSALNYATPSLYGNTLHSLQKEDVAYNYLVGVGPSGEDVHLEYNDEPCWEYDIDWLRYYSYGYRYMSIVVTPDRSDFDVSFKIYNAYSQLIASVNSHGAGYSESYGWNDGQGFYKIRICAGSGFGGVYDLDVYLMS